MTCHPRMGAAQLPEVAARRLVENKAIRETSFVPVAAGQL
jgi:hypothetical protein